MRAPPAADGPAASAAATSCRAMFFVVPFCLASISCRCWSLTLRLRCSCSLSVGSCVWKPGERHATPRSLMASPADSFDAMGAPAVCGPREAELLADRSSRRGRGRDVAAVGDAGSFLTLIFGGPREL